MIPFIRTAWSEVLSPILNRPPVVQIAALCLRDGDKGTEVLLVTSSNGRWILPKGWPIDGLAGAQTALQEAWEEAGVKEGRASKEPVGSYMGRKTLDTGVERPCRTYVYMIEVRKVVSDYPESDKRKRKWVTPTEAAQLMDEPDLIALVDALLNGK